MNNKENQNQGISLYEKDGRKWVRVNVYKHDFLLGMFDLCMNNKKNLDWVSAVEAAKKIGCTLPNREEWELIDVYKDEINRIITENNGDILNDVYWSVARYYSNLAWLYLADYGRLDTDILYDGFTARPLTYPGEN